jgi:hypothetical protein
MMCEIAEFEPGGGHGRYSHCARRWGCPPPPPGPPDFTKPGTDGPPVAQPVREATFDSANVTTAPPPVCGVTFQVSGRANEPAAGGTCQGQQNYQLVYQRALAMADAALLSYKCPQGCRPLQSAIKKQRWECVSIMGPANLVASVEKDVICPRPDIDPAPQGLPMAPPPPLTRKNRSQGNPALPIFEETKDGALACPATNLAVLTYKKTVPACQGLNFQPHVADAVAQAKAYHASHPCPQGCTLQPFQVIRREWNCTGQGDVEVKVYFNVACRP